MSTVLYFMKVVEGNRLAFQAGLSRRRAGSAVTANGKSGPLMAHGVTGAPFVSFNANSNANTESDFLSNTTTTLSR
jgi:hypothetical protein